MKNMRLFYSLVLCLFFSACAAPKLKNAAPVEVKRIPSSSVDEENLNTSFDLLMSSEDPEKEYFNYLNRLKSIFLRAEAQLVEFDAEVDKALANSSAVNFEESKSYKKLLVMRALGHRLEDKIIFHYVKLTEVAYNKSLPVEKRKLAKTILKNFKKKLDSKDFIEKITFDELKSHIALTIRERRGMMNKSFTAEVVPAKNFINDQEKLKVLRKYREKLRVMGKKEQVEDDELNQKIEKETNELQFSDDSGRAPQSELKYFPSTGTNGNIMGLVFPKNVWALTFDDGPNPVHTPAIIKNLESLEIKATFFWLAQNVIRYQGVVDLVKEKEMALANHSWSHPQLPKLGEDDLKKEVIKSTEVESIAYGEQVKYFRCPYGAGNSVLRIRQMIADLGMIHVFWNVDTLDWQDKDPDSILERTKKQMKANGRGVVLFHDIHPQSVIASKKLVEWSKSIEDSENQIRWVTIPEIVKELNGEKE